MHCQFISLIYGYRCITLRHWLTEATLLVCQITKHLKLRSFWSGVLGCDIVQSGRWVLLFGRNIWPTSSEMKAVITSEMLVLTYQTIRCHYQEDNMKNVSKLLQQYNHIILYLKPMKEMEQNATPVEGLLHETGQWQNSWVHHNLFPSSFKRQFSPVQKCSA